MPTYEYECKECGHNFEVFQSMSDEPLKTCVKCGKEVRRLIFGGAGVIFKGSGFYVTDKGKKQSGKSSGTESKKTAETVSKTEQTASTGTAVAESKTPPAGDSKAKPAAKTA